MASAVRMPDAVPRAAAGTPTNSLSSSDGLRVQARVVDLLVPELVSTARLRLRRPTSSDAPEILACYAGDPEVTRLLAWPRHRSVADSLAFVEWSDDAWSTRGVGPYLVVDLHGRVVGTTGLDVETPWRASTGYVLARDAWGRGYATEIAMAMIRLADDASLRRLYALCHPVNQASARVLEKAGFRCEGVLRQHTVFPGLDPEEPADVECWASTR